MQAVQEIVPNPAAPGTDITINGSGFSATQGTSEVRYDGAALWIVSWSDGAVVAHLPDSKPPGSYAVSLVVGGTTLPAGNHTVVDLAVGEPVGTVNPDNHLALIVSFQTTVPALPLLDVSGPDGTGPFR